MNRPPRLWGWWIAAFWFLGYAAIALFNLSGAIVPILMGVLALLAAVLLLFGSGE